MARVLSSMWSGLNPRLLATIYPVSPQGLPQPDQPSVAAPITDGNIELSANWQSPFEQSGPETKAPAIMSMLQSGLLEGVAVTLLGRAVGGEEDSLRSRLSSEVVDFSRTAQGRTGMTKLNSTQAFTGAPPVKLPFTMHFRAFRDPKAEVEEPVDQLTRWMLAQELAPNGSIVSAVRAFRSGQGFLKALLPSRVPQMVGLSYGGYTFSPMVIENMTRPITVPRATDGGALHMQVQLVLATLTALDEGDWRRARAGKPTQLFNNDSTGLTGATGSAIGSTRR
jgi:hypothetical protein